MTIENFEKYLTSMGGPSHELLAIKKYLLNIDRTYEVLDLGCGDGRNSVYLSSLGHNVTAIDSSSAYISFLKRVANLGNYQINSVCSDVRCWNLENSYDVILAHGLLHYFAKNEAVNFINKIKFHTTEGGINVITIAPSTQQGDIPQDFKRAGHVNPFFPMELISLYSDWRVILREHYVKWDYHPGIGIHSHPIEKWIFVKPGKNEFPISARKIRTKLNKHYVESVLESEFNKVLINTRFSDSYFYSVTMNNIYNYEVTGIQLSSKRLSTSGYQLDLYQVWQYVFYVVEDIIVGKSKHYADIHEITTDENH